jgi:hypothetical protein
VADLYFDEEADRTLTALDADPTRAQLAERVNEVLDALERDPGSATLRRHRFQIGVWGVVVSGSGDDWIVLWEPHPTLDDAVIIQYIGPASFT